MGRRIVQWNEREIERAIFAKQVWKNEDCKITDNNWNCIGDGIRNRSD